MIKSGYTFLIFVTIGCFLQHCVCGFTKENADGSVQIPLPMKTLIESEAFGDLPNKDSLQDKEVHPSVIVQSIVQTEASPTQWMNIVSYDDTTCSSGAEISYNSYASGTCINYNAMTQLSVKISCSTGGLAVNQFYDGFDCVKSKNTSAISVPVDRCFPYSSKTVVSQKTFRYQCSQVLSSGDITTAATSAPIDTAIRYTVRQTLAGITTSSYLSSKINIENVLKLVVAQVIPSISKDNIQFTNYYRRRLLPTSPDLGSANKETTEEYANKNHEGLPQEEIINSEVSNSVTVEYLIYIPSVQTIGYATAASAYTQTTTQLKASISSGTFTATMQSYATTNAVTVLKTVLANDIPTMTTYSTSSADPPSKSNTASPGLIGGCIAGAVVGIAAAVYAYIQRKRAGQVMDTRIMPFAPAANTAGSSSMSMPYSGMMISSSQVQPSSYPYPNNTAYPTFYPAYSSYPLSLPHKQQVPVQASDYSQPSISTMPMSLPLSLPLSMTPYPSYPQQLQQQQPSLSLSSSWAKQQYQPQQPQQQPYGQMMYPSSSNSSSNNVPPYAATINTF